MTDIKIAHETTDEKKAGLLKHARIIAANFGDGEIDGYFVIAWNAYGEFSAGWNCAGEGIGPRLSTALVKEVASEMREKVFIEEVIRELP